MNKSPNSLFLILVLLLVGLLSYFLGKKSGSAPVENIILNNAFVKDISELSSIEVHGTATIKSTNLANDGSLQDELKKLFSEKTINISVPYVAKYGVKLEKQKIQIEEKNKVVTVRLPLPELLSYELRLDRIDAMTRKGLLLAADETAFQNVQKKLYAQSREQLVGNQIYIEQAKTNVSKIIQNYYAPMQLKVEIIFTEKNSNQSNRNLQ